MTQVSEKNGKCKSTKFIAPATLAKELGHGSRSRTPCGNAASHMGKVDSEKRLIEEQENTNFSRHRIIGGISTHTLVMHFDNHVYKERNFDEDSRFFDLLKICQKFVDIHAVGMKIEDDIGLPLKCDKDIVALFKKYASVKVIHLHVETDEVMEPVRHHVPRSNPNPVSIPIVVDVVLSDDIKANEKVSVRADVIYGNENASTFQFFTTRSKKFVGETGLVAVSECTTNKVDPNSCF